MKSPYFGRTLAFSIAGAVAYNALGALVQNPSFETNYNDVWPHYGAVDAWAGASGVNDASGPFHNNGTPIPDRTRVGFKQGGGTVSQEITGLTAGKQYHLQFLYDARNCCGGTVDIITKWNDTQLDKAANVKAVTGGAGYYSASVAFTADADTGTVTFETVVAGDATALFDGVTIVQRDKDPDPADTERQYAVVMNPSFEASGVVDDTVSFETDGIAGWTKEGAASVTTAGVGTLADNGTVPDQDNVAVLSGISSISQTVPNIRIGGKVDITISYNARTGQTPHIQLKSGATILFEEDVTAVGGANAYKTKTVTLTAADVSLPITIAQTVDGQTLLVDDVKVVAPLIKEFGPISFDPAGVELAPGQKATATVQLDPNAVATKAWTIKLRSPNPDIATLTGADVDGIVTLQFAKGGADHLTFEVEAVSRGVVRIEVVDSGGLKLLNDVAVGVVTSFVRNSSFEGNTAGPFPGYGTIAAWTQGGGTGLNKADGPFHDNGVIPDRNQIAFLQGSTKISQTIFGLVPGDTYWLQFRYNARNCCGDPLPDVNLTASLAGKEAGKIAPIVRALEQNPYGAAHFAFTGEVATAELELASSVAAGDGTGLVDAVTIVHRSQDPAHPDVIVQNPSFEADGSPVGVGYLGPQKISGWDVTGGYGINIDTVGPFTDNGVAGDQDRVLFIQGAGAASQLLTGLVAGETYTLSYSVNVRNCCTAGPGRHATFVDDVPLFAAEEDGDLSPVGAGQPFQRKYLQFTAAGTEATIKISHTPPDGDRTLLIDNVRVQKGIVLPPLAAPGPIAAASGTDGTVHLSWPSASGGNLLSAPKVDGPWSPVNDPTTDDGAGTIFIDLPTAGPDRYFRLSGN
jgi:hypothetical protein